MNKFKQIILIIALSLCLAGTITYARINNPSPTTALTPWAENIDGGGFTLNNVSSITSTGDIIVGDGSQLWLPESGETSNIVLYSYESATLGLGENETGEEIYFDWTGVDSYPEYIFPNWGGGVLISSSTSITMELDGDIGIATTTPAVALDVNGIIKTQPTSVRTCNALATGGIMYDSDDNHFYGCNGSAWLQLDN